MKILPLRCRLPHRDRADCCLTYRRYVPDKLWNTPPIDSWHHHIPPGVSYSRLPAEKSVYLSTFRHPVSPHGSGPKEKLRIISTGNGINPYPILHIFFGRASGTCRTKQSHDYIRATFINDHSFHTSYYFIVK